MDIINVVGGALLLTLGRKIFWLFVAATGFYAGFELASQYLHITPEWVAISIALAVGLIGALLAYFFQKLVIGAAGFLSGAYIASRLAPQLGAQVKSWEWLVILIGGIIGIVLIYVIFEWALVILSSLAGAILIVDGLKLVGTVAMIAGGILFVIGLVFQTGINRQKRTERKAAS
jgi:MFS family permease